MPNTSGSNPELLSYQLFCLVYGRVECVIYFRLIYNFPRRQLWVQQNIVLLDIFHAGIRVQCATPFVTDCQKSTYPYMGQLLQLEQCKNPNTLNLPAQFNMITSPQKLKRWEEVLVDLPDRQLKDYLLRGITEGFRIGFDYNLLSKLRSSSTNLLSAAENPDIVDSYLAKELHLGRIAHVCDPSALPFLQYSPFGVIPKKYKPGKWRLIFNLSAPHNHSVNDGILKELCSFSYVSVDDVVSSILPMGRGTLMAKLDNLSL